MAPTYTILTSAYFDENLLEVIWKTYCINIKTEFIKSWKRCPNNCFIFLKCSWGNINNLLNLDQNLHPKIKVTIEHNFKELLFLDILIKNQNSQIITDIYPFPHTNTVYIPPTYTVYTCIYTKKKQH